MVYKLNILHFLVALGATGCAGVLLREARGRLLRPVRLFAAPFLAAVAALFLLALVAPEAREPRLWAVALALGGLSGALRGFAMTLQVDHMWSTCSVMAKPRSAPDSPPSASATAHSRGSRASGATSASRNSAATAARNGAANRRTGRSRRPRASRRRTPAQPVAPRATRKCRMLSL